MLDVTIDDKYRAQTGQVVMTGIQALVRLTFDQHKRDAANGLRTATLVSGYRGSPLGGLDLAFGQAADLAEQHHVHFLNGINEDLAATAIYGSQLANTMPGPRYDGVVGMWYGKGPGVDRSGDAFRHANIAGVARNGGVLAVAGDDPSAKSSTVASASEFALLDAHMPVLYPSTVQEVLEFGLTGYALSRFSGSWVGLKIVTNVADAFSTVTLGNAPRRVLPTFEVDGRPWAHTQNPMLIAPASIAQEREVANERAGAIREFLAANPLNQMIVNPPDAWLGIVSAGKPYRELRDAFAALGLDESGLAAIGVRLLKLGAIHPLEPKIVRAFARGLDEILVVEEKRPFVELFLRDLLYGTANAPRILGKNDETGTPLLPAHGELDVDTIRRVVRGRLLQRVAVERLAPEPTVTPRRLIPLSAHDVRTPYFCSGCPHNRSTVVPEGSIAHGAVGCSTMSIWMDRRTENIVQMGAEGAQWVGAAPFTDTPHIFQNMGDGTFLHSGSLAIRQAVAAGTNVTYKLLYNAAVAMTGGQAHDAQMSLAGIIASIEAEGVARLLLVSDDPDGRRSELRNGLDIWHRDRVLEAQELLRATPGVTVLIYDQACAADLRRNRKRGKVATPTFRIMINEQVCEGCGDCGAASNCLSVQPVDTLLGRKTRIDQSSCNLDASCTLGRCPAFIRVTPAEARPSGRLTKALTNVTTAKRSSGLRAKTAGLNRARPNVTRPNVTESNRARSNRTEPNATESKRTESKRTESKRTESNRAESDRAESNVTRPNVTESNPTESNRAEFNRARSNRTGSKRTGFKRPEFNRKGSNRTALKGAWSNDVKRRLTGLGDSLPEPVRRVGDDVRILMTGIGGTGVVTVSQILGMAARTSGLFSTGLDQTGLAQKGGSVISHLRVSPTPIDGANLIGAGAADVLLAFDSVAAGQDINLARLDAARTVAVVNTATSPTGPMVRDVQATPPNTVSLVERIGVATRASEMVRLDIARLSDAAFGNQIPANLILLGAAYQAGLVPIAAAAIERAIEINGAGAAANHQAFRLGRTAVATPESIDRALDSAGQLAPRNVPRLSSALKRRLDTVSIPPDVRDLVTFCTTNLAAYQSDALALAYLDEVAAIAAHEPGGQSALTEAAARNLHHLIAVKDEYEVARLHRAASARAAVEEQFGAGASIEYLLQPPALHRVGLKRKIALRRSAPLAFAALASMRRTRGTAFDLFGRSAHRRMERGLADEFRSHIAVAVAVVSTSDLPARYEAAVTLLRLAGDVRGFDEVKERNVATWRTAAERAIATLTESR